MIEADDDPVVVFIVSRDSTYARRRVLWKMSRADAKKVCTDERTTGLRHALHWTAHGVDDFDLMEYVHDGGNHYQVLVDHGVRVLRSKTVRGVVKNSTGGVKVSETRDRLTQMIRRALSAEGATASGYDGLDRVAAGVVDELLAVEVGHVGWLLMGDTETVVPLVECDMQSDSGSWLVWGPDSG